jgi:hypothetical protein
MMMEELIEDVIEGAFEFEKEGEGFIDTFFDIGDK